MLRNRRPYATMRMFCSYLDLGLPVVILSSFLTSCQFTNEPNREISKLGTRLWNFQNRGVCAASSTVFPRAKWGLGNSQASEKRKRGMMGTSVERERGVMERKRSFPSFPLSLIINSNIPQWSRATGDEAGFADKRFLFSPPLPFSLPFFFLLSLYLSRNNSIENACYEGYDNSNNIYSRLFQYKEHYCDIANDVASPFSTLSQQLTVKESYPRSP